MPKQKHSLAIKLDLLKPQSNPEKILIKLFRWMLSSGRYIFVFVEAIVLIAFIARFKLDADLAAKKEAIEDMIPYIESLKPYETLIRDTQLQLSTIEKVRKNSPDWVNIFKKIADQTPAGVKIISIKMLKNTEGAGSAINIAGESQQNTDLNSFIAGLKEDSVFSNIAVASIGLEQGVMKFSINVLAKNI